MTSILGFVLTLAVVCASSSQVSGQESPADRMANSAVKAVNYYEEANSALVAANGASNEVVHQTYLSDAIFAATQGTKWCGRTNEALLEMAAVMNSGGCAEAQALYSATARFMLDAGSEMATASQKLSNSLEAVNPFYVRRMHDEAAVHLATARRYIKMATEELGGAMDATKRCLNE